MSHTYTDHDSIWLVGGLYGVWYIHTSCLEYVISRQSAMLSDSNNKNRVNVLVMKTPYILHLSKPKRYLDLLTQILLDLKSQTRCSFFHKDRSFGDYTTMSSLQESDLSFGLNRH